MKIISKFTDYYDSMRCYANPAYCSDDFTYKRVTSDVEIPEDKLRFTLKHEGSDHNKEINRHIIGFCGQWYFIYSIKTSDNYYNSANEYLNYTFFIHAKDALRYNWNFKYIKKCFASNNFGYNSIFQKNKKSSFDATISKVLDIYTIYEREKLLEFSQYLNSLKLFTTYNVPVIEVKLLSAWRESTVTLNPNLEKLSFYKIIEGNIAYMTLESFLSNELIPRDDPDQLKETDINKAERHGFDKITSFRKQPTKKEKHKKRAKHKEHKLNKHNKGNKQNA